MEREINYIISKTRNCETLRLMVNHHQVGVLQCHKEGRYYRVSIINVLKDERRKGYGSMLLNKLSTLSSNHKMKGIMLKAYPFNGSSMEDILQFYSKNGFVSITKNEDNALILKKIF